MIGRTKCAIHGGKTPVGFASPNTITGRFSKYLPQRLLATYEEARNNPKLLILRDDLALLEARLADLLTRVDTGESGATWIATRKAFDAVSKARDDGDPVAESEALVQLESIIEKGLADHAIYTEIIAVIEQRRKLSESERKRMVEAQAVIQVDRMLVMTAQLSESIRKHVNDNIEDVAVRRRVLQGISLDLGRMLHHGDAAPAPAGLPRGDDPTESE